MLFQVFSNVLIKTFADIFLFLDKKNFKKSLVDFVFENVIAFLKNQVLYILYCTVDVLHAFTPDQRYWSPPQRLGVSRRAW